MADIKLDFAWAIEEDGEVEITVHPAKHRDVVLGSMTLDEDLFLEELDGDITEYLQGESDAIFLDRENLADLLGHISQRIEAKIEAAKGLKNPPKDYSKTFSKGSN